ncbi:hypothetical protein NDU88_000995 [Pleurodeles waltl]|uniref:Uncharacterized protein n=1 Tax=Pleurodeles waltl TaxID=8319 RepID=A0AAV7NC84_PLEWA|nr:hypothetical protein NDU88_000995 [Pleurodeles waltl]
MRGRGSRFCDWLHAEAFPCATLIIASATGAERLHPGRALLSSSVRPAGRKSHARWACLLHLEHEPPPQPPHLRKRKLARRAGKDPTQKSELLKSDKASRSHFAHTRYYETCL